MPAPASDAPSDAAGIARRLVDGGLRDAGLLRGERGLRYFGPHGLTTANQADVIDRVDHLLSALIPRT
jgi:hypothetical protein